MAKLDLTNTVIDILKENQNRSYTARELSEAVYHKKPQECREKIERTHLKNVDQLLTQLTCEISARRLRTIATDKTGVVSYDDERPIRYQYVGIHQNKTQTKERHNNHPEHDMYPLLCDYLSDQDTGLSLFPKRIDERKSKKGKGTAGKNVWLHPDIVAFKNLSISWNDATKACSENNSFNKFCFYSFEVKDEVATISNLREMFFQTVSNSSWANYSYLVVPKIRDKKARNELEILCNRHSIGVIELDVTDPVGGSKIAIQANKKETIDWDIVNRLCEENSDFEDFIGIVNNHGLQPEQIGKLLGLKDFTKED